jgi:hypothetical protein
MFGKALFHFLIVAMAFVFGVPAFTQDTQAIEKNLPDELYGEWCFDSGTTRTNYKLPSWAKKCDTDKILSVGRQWLSAGDARASPIVQLATWRNTSIYSSV